MGRMPRSEGFIPPHGEYAGLAVYHKALLDQLIRKLEKDFLAEGGLRERMTRARLAHRAKHREAFVP